MHEESLGGHLIARSRKAGLFLPRAKGALTDLGDIPPYLFGESVFRGKQQK
jgi:hypothetical protein